MGVSFDTIDRVIWYDGKLVPWRDANVHLLTHVLHYASCVFEGERAYSGEMFRSTAQLMHDYAAEVQPEQVAA